MTRCYDNQVHLQSGKKLLRDVILAVGVLQAEVELVIRINNRGAVVCKRKLIALCSSNNHF